MSDVRNPQYSLSQQSLQSLVDNFPNGVLALLDEGLEYRVVGPKSDLFSDRTAGDVVGRSVDELFPAAIADRLASELLATLDGEDRSFDIDFEGETHHVETRLVRLDGDRHAVMVTQSVTEVRRESAELAQTNERLDEFASMVSHDFRNHLNVAHGRLDLFRETADESHLDDVERALERIEELTTDLTALAQHGSVTQQTERVSVADLARDAWRVTDTRSATLSVESHEMTGDSGQLQALFENLFRNAVGHGGPAVTVRVGPLDDGFYVEDTGTGIPPESRDEVFDHGFTTSYSGNGVGLAIVGRIADAHNLTVSLSESVEGGARFEFRPTADAGRDSTSL